MGSRKDEARAPGRLSGFTIHRHFAHRDDSKGQNFARPAVGAYGNVGQARFRDLDRDLVARIALREHLDVDIAAAHLVISGQSVVLCRGDELIDVLAGDDVRAVRALVDAPG